MDFIGLLGSKLKDDDIIEILEDNNLQTIYEFDRLHENTDDIYWVQAEDNGFIFRFDQNQILDTIFLYITKEGNINKIDSNEIEFKLYKTIDEVRNEFIKLNINYKEGYVDEGMDNIQCWIKGMFSNYSIHYQYKNSKLNLVTIMKNC